MVAFPPEPEPADARSPTAAGSRAMIRRPLRPLARILTARAEGTRPEPRRGRGARRAARGAAPRRAGQGRDPAAAARGRLRPRLLDGRRAHGAARRRGAGRAARRRRGEPIHAQRADIVDRNGAVLATNIVTASLYAQPREMIDPRRRRRGARGDLPRPRRRRRSSPASPTGASSSGSSARSRPSSASSSTTSASPGLLFGPREARLYPNGAVAAHVLGGASFGREGVRRRRGDRHRRRRAGLRRAAARPGADRRAAAALDRPRGAGRARGGARRGHGRDARQGRRRHPDGGRHRADPRAGEPAGLRPEPAPAAADQRRPGRQPALQPRRPGPLRARLGLQAVHGRRRRSTRAWSPRRP